MGLSMVSAPAELPVSVAVARQQVNVAGTARDELLALYVAAATDRVERFLGRTLIDTTWDAVFDAFPKDGAALEAPQPPLIELIGVFYTDDAGVEQEIDAADLIVDAARHPARITPVSGSWPTPRAAAASVRVRFRAGYLDAGVSPPVANVPAAIKAGVLLFVGELYANREPVVVGDTVAEVPGFIQGLLRPYRVRLGMA